MKPHSATMCFPFDIAHIVPFKKSSISSHEQVRRHIKLIILYSMPLDEASHSKHTMACFSHAHILLKHVHIHTHTYTLINECELSE